MRGLLLLLSRLPPWLLVVCFLGLTVLTGNKLWRMAQVRGWVAGAQTLECAATRKWQEGEAYYVEFDLEGTLRGERVGRELWDDLDEGATVEVRYAPGDRKPHLVRGLYASAGNLAFDGFLFLLWVTGVVWNARRTVQRRALKSLQRARSE